MENNLLIGSNKLHSQFTYPTMVVPDPGLVNAVTSELKVDLDRTPLRHLEWLTIAKN